MLPVRKYVQSEDFIGWKSDDGLLEVVGIHGRTGKKNNVTTFKVICHKCKKDKELFPDGYFVTVKQHLINGQKPCGCSKSPKWTKEQYLILARRTAKGRFIVHSFSEEFRGSNTKLNLECLIDGRKWTASISNIINNGSGCQMCKARMLGYDKRNDEQEVLSKCKTICKVEGYEHIGFVDGYKNNQSLFEYKCPTHGIQNVSYTNFISGRRCKLCWKERQKDLGNGNGYYPDRKDEIDYLYVLSFNDEFIKVGRSFDVERRISKNELQKESGVSNIIKIRILTGTHREIYDLEQELHSELRERNFQHHVDWSTECFTSDSLPFLKMLLDKCGLEEVKL
jgi:hypothetical protein